MAAPFLTLPSGEYKDSYLRALAEYHAAGRHLSLDIPTIAANFAAHIQQFSDWADETKLTPGEVPETMYWLIADGEVIGQVSVRHRASDEVLQWRGYIGGEIVPSRRGQGYGRELLRLALVEARGFGLARVVITCDADNSASRRIIESLGGVLENEVEREGSTRLRYWIEMRLSLLPNLSHWKRLFAASD